jgi:uncharacterized protein
MALSQFLIIDGYNLMHAAGMARLRYGPGELERCRHRFLRYLALHLPQAQRERTTIVFDAHDAPPGAPARSVWQGMEILFARADGDADALIEQLLQHHSAPRRIRLVSSDHRLQRAAQKRRAAFIDSELFFDELERHGAVGKMPTEPPPSQPPANPKYGGTPIPAEEVEEWLHIFGESAEPPEMEDDEVRRWQPFDGDLPEDVDDLNDWLEEKD